MLSSGKFIKLTKSTSSIKDGHIDYDDQMDPLMIPICDEFNRICGLQTLACCEGHYDKDHRLADHNPYILFLVDDIKALVKLRYIVNEIGVRSKATEIWKSDVDYIPHWDLSFGSYMPKWNDVEIEGDDKVKCILDSNIRCAKERDTLLKLTMDALSGVVRQHRDPLISVKFPNGLLGTLVEIPKEQWKEKLVTKHLRFLEHLCSDRDVRKHVVVHSGMSSDKSYRASRICYDNRDHSVNLYYVLYCMQVIGRVRGDIRISITGIEEHSLRSCNVNGNNELLRNSSVFDAYIHHLNNRGYLQRKVANIMIIDNAICDDFLSGTIFNIELERV